MTADIAVNAAKAVVRAAMCGVDAPLANLGPDGPTLQCRPFHNAGQPVRDTPGITPRELMSDYVDTVRRGDWQTAFGFFADDIVLRIPGRSELSGERRGRDPTIANIETVRERFHGDRDPTEIRRANLYRVRGDEPTSTSSTSSCTRPPGGRRRGRGAASAGPRAPAR